MHQGELQQATNKDILKGLSVAGCRKSTNSDRDKLHNLTNGGIMHIRSHVCEGYDP